MPMRFQSPFVIAVAAVLSTTAYAQSAEHPRSDPDLVALRSSERVEGQLNSHVMTSSDEEPAWYGKSVDRGHAWGRCVIDHDRESAISYIMTEHSSQKDPEEFHHLFETCRKVSGAFYQDHKPAILKSAIRDALVKTGEADSLPVD
jgi:hypothetical protein